MTTYKLDIVDHIHRLAQALLVTELTGIKIDVDYAMQLGEELLSERVKVTQAIQDSAPQEIRLLEERLREEILQKKRDKLKTAKGRANVKISPEEYKFNLNSTPHKGKLLFEVIGLPGIRKKSTGNWVTNKHYLEEIADLHPITQGMRNYNQVNTLYATFIDGMLSRTESGIVYPSFKVTGTDTGRLAHQNPNFGNLPSRGSWSKIRGIVLPFEGEAISSFDYSQLEICVAAHFTQDKNLLKIVKEGVSMHDITSQELGIVRDLAKTCNFALQYQCGPQKLQHILKCDESHARTQYDKYWSTYSGQRQYMDWCKKQMIAGKPLVNPFGRKRRFEPGAKPEWHKANRQPYSFMVQSTGSDLTSWSFYTSMARLKDRGIKVRGFTVHDELVKFHRVEDTPIVDEVVTKTMVEAGEMIGLTVPLSTGKKIGLSRWEK